MLAVTGANFAPMFSMNCGERGEGGEPLCDHHWSKARFRRMVKGSLYIGLPTLKKKRLTLDKPGLAAPRRGPAR